MRNKTERPEGIIAGNAKLAGVNAKNIINETAVLLDNVDTYQQMSIKHNPYGDGQAANRIVEILEQSIPF